MRRLASLDLASHSIILTYAQTDDGRGEFILRYKQIPIFRGQDYNPIIQSKVDTFNAMVGLLDLLTSKTNYDDGIQEAFSQTADYEDIRIMLDLYQSRQVAERNATAGYLIGSFRVREFGECR